MSNKAASETNQPKVLIIGAGAAGIAAATKLLKNGFEDVTILEAEDRIGGRIHSVEFGGTVIDLGAQWVHGEKGNTVYELVKDLNVLGSHSSSSYDKYNFFISDQSKLNKNLLDRLYDIASDILEDSEAFVRHGGVINEYFTKHYYEQVLSEFGKDNKDVIHVAELLEEWISKFALCLDPAESWNQIYSDGFRTYVNCGGNPLLHWKDKGYRTLFNILMKNTSLESKIQLNKEVTKISWTKNINCPNKVTVQCSDGSVYYADHIIVTVSLTVLKDFFENVFVPKPSKAKIEAVKQIPLGNIIKIFLKFPRKWWSDDVPDFSFLWTKEDKEKLLEEFSEGPVFNGRLWLQDLFGFYSVESHPDILLGWLVGPMTKQVELIPEETLLKGSMFLLRKFLSKNYDIPEAEHIIRSTWGTNAHFKGTYSYVNAESTDSDEVRRQIIEPLNCDGKDVVLFAGEATHRKYFSTVHGAVDSGYREADRLIQFYKKRQNHKIVIVGAGMAGLGAASELMQNNVEEFVILESQDRPGGRIETIMVDHKPLDLGAQWLHGKDNPLYHLAMKHDLLSDEMSEEGLGLYVRGNGEIVDSFTVERTSFEIGKILEDCQNFTNSDDHPPSIESYLKQRFDSYINCHSNMNEREVLRELYDWHLRFQVIDNSCLSLSKLSAKSWGDYVCLDDVAHYNLKYGYNSLVEVILDDLPKGCVKYNSEVTRIYYENDNKVVLELSDKQVIVCDHLILTPSLGVLKTFGNLSDILPENIVGSIERMGFAGICKIYLFYEDRWWGDSRGFQLLWNKECNFSEKYSWLRHVTGFDEVFNHPNALMTWVGGVAVEEVESLASDKIGKQCTDLLRKFIPSYAVPLPSRVIRTKWLTKPSVRGSYCHITPECDGTGYGIRTMGKPVVVDGVPRILLAGEAVHPSHFSTTHGAYESGQRQAQLLSEYLRTSQ
ncbi:spermine oxidase-like isoform X4 [Sitophilus oryzae]|nr:spermine oxidase-like isoform X4 [Sitophilus oryzae]XP_030754643.1 spermine oxidase-like isoform X4 [Sitophilus oryzae]